jgi:hypothetical protein
MSFCTVGAPAQLRGDAEQSCEIDNQERGGPSSAESFCISIAISRTTFCLCNHHGYDSGIATKGRFSLEARPGDRNSNSRMNCRAMTRREAV